MTQDEIDQLFFEQVNTDARRVMYCAPGHFDAVTQMVAQNGWTDHVEIRVSSIIVDPHNIYVVDERAIDAAMAQHFQRRGL